eukprot:8227984-Alexandrium_andersonii.AAC.1
MYRTAALSSGNTMKLVRTSRKSEPHAVEVMSLLCSMWLRPRRTWRPPPRQPRALRPRRWRMPT